MRRAIDLCFAVIAIVGVVFLAIPDASAQGRVALVIGNSTYSNKPVLVNPQNDANDVAAALERLSFAVTRVENGDFNTMRRAILSFGQRTRGAEIAVVFYAGHGMEIGGENWLIPTDAELKTDIGVDQEAIGLKSLMLSVSSAAKLGLVILDACRDNPFAVKMQRSMRTRSVDRGLVRIEPTGSVLVAYAAKDGTVANDGVGRNSPFTTALLRHIETPGLEVSFLFRNVRDDVLSATGREQEPFVYGSLSRDPIYFKLGAPGAAAVAPPAGTQLSSLTPPPPASAPQALPLPASMTGVWVGTYSYSNGSKVGFSFAFDSQCRGRSEEVNTFGRKDAPKLFANLRCDATRLRPGQTVNITKTYDGTGGVSHSVRYSGVVSADGNEISGQWAIGPTKGGFNISRQ